MNYNFGLHTSSAVCFKYTRCESPIGYERNRKEHPYKVECAHPRLVSSLKRFPPFGGYRESESRASGLFRNLKRTKAE